MTRVALLLAIFAFVNVPSIAQDEADVIKVESNLVVLNATITDIGGKPVAGLKQDRFTVLENGVEQKIQFFSAEETPFAAVILLDTSGSMEERVSMARAAAIKFLEGLRESDVASIYRFDSQVKLVQDFSPLRDIDDRVFDVRSGGMTRLYDAIATAAEALSKRPERRRAIIVLSDGEDTQSGHGTDSALRAALKADAAIYTVDMSSMEMGGSKRVQNASVLKNFAERTGGRFVATPGGIAMRQAFEQIVAELGTQYTLAYEPSNIARDGKWRAIELRVAKKDLYIRTRKGYNAPKKTEPRQ